MPSEDLKSEENLKVEPEGKNCGTPEINTTVCKDARCKICNSDYLKEIHDLRKAGHRFSDMVKILKKKFNYDIGQSSLCRHFQKYQAHKNLISAKIINGEIIEEATKQSAHTKHLIDLIDEAFRILKARVTAGNIRIDISDLDKLIKMRYQIMSGQDMDENDVLAIFQKATDKYGLNIQQGVLFKSSNGAEQERDEQAE